MVRMASASSAVAGRTSTASDYCLARRRVLGHWLDDVEVAHHRFHAGPCCDVGIVGEVNDLGQARGSAHQLEHPLLHSRVDAFQRLVEDEREALAMGAGVTEIGQPGDERLRQLSRLHRTEVETGALTRGHGMGYP